MNHTTYDPVLPAGWLIITHPDGLTLRQHIAHNTYMESRGAYRHPDDWHTFVLQAEYPNYEKKKLIRAGISEQCITITHTPPPQHQRRGASTLGDQHIGYGDNMIGSQLS